MQMTNGENGISMHIWAAAWSAAVLWQGVCAKMSFDWFHFLDQQSENLESFEAGLGAGRVIAWGLVPDEPNESGEWRMSAVVADATSVAVYRPVGEAKPRQNAAFKQYARLEVAGVEGAVLADVDHDGFADLVLYVKENGGIRPVVYLRDIAQGKTFEKAKWTVPLFKSQPTLVDTQSRFALDFLGVPVDIASHENSASAPNESNKLGCVAALFSAVTETVTGYAESAVVFAPLLRNPVALPTYIAVADMNGDGLPDIVVPLADADKTGMTSVAIFWRAMDGDNIRTDVDNMSYFALPAGTNSLAVADMDGDGYTDIVASVCAGDDCAAGNGVQIVYADPGAGGRYCAHGFGSTDCIVPTAETVWSKRDVSFPLGKSTLLSLPQMLKDAGYSSPDTFVVAVEDSGAPISLVIGDADIDSLPDIALVARTRDGKSSVPVLLWSRGTEQKDGERRTLIAAKQADGPAKEMLSITDARSVAFADLRNGGPPGFVVNTAAGPAAFRSGIGADAFFLRAAVLSGVCPHQCAAKRGALSRASRPHGASFPGAAVRVFFEDSRGHQVRAAGQTPMSANRAMCWPRAQVGLGMLSSFAHFVAVGTAGSSPSAHGSLGLARYVHEHANVIPNSDVVFSPPHADSPDAWAVELLVHPSHYVPYVLATTLATLLVLTALTAAFKWREMREDDAERRKRTHLVNFDAL